MVALALAAGGCDSPVGRSGSTLPGQCQAEAPLLQPERTDILFVIDDSGSMAEEQAGIREELPAFIEALRAGGGVAQDFRVAVITTSVYEQAVTNQGPRYREFPEAGRLRPVPLADGSVGTERFLAGTDPELVDKFRRLVVQGVGGSGQEAPFEAVRLALTPAARCGELGVGTGTNQDGSIPCVGDVPVEQGGTQGFLRDGVRLLVVVVTDEEDCSSAARPPGVEVRQGNPVDECVEADRAGRIPPVAQYAALFQGLRDGTGAPRPLLWAAIAPVARGDKRAEIEVEGNQVRNVDCPTSFGPGFRHRALAERFASSPDDPENLASICPPDNLPVDYRQSLIDIAGLTIDQTLEVVNVPDERLLVVQLRRAGGNVQACTTSNGGIRFQPAADGQPARVVFQSSCLRRGDDQVVDIQVLCAS